MTNFFSVSDKFWNEVSPLLIKKQRDVNTEYKRQAGGG